MTRRAAKVIQAVTCEHFGIERDELLGEQRYKDLVRARHLCMYICRERLGLSFPEIGIVFGDRDHTTIMHACKSVRERLGAEPLMREHLASIEQLLTEVSTKKVPT